MSSTIPRVVLKPQRAQPFHGRHPWVFAGSIDRALDSPKDGDVVDLYSSDREFVARGLFNAQSKIRVRLYSWNENRPLDQAFFHHAIKTAITLRHDLLQLNRGPDAAYRVVASEGDQLSGLTVDRYGDYLAVQFTSLALANRAEMIADSLMELLQPKGIYLRTERGIGQLEGLTLRDGLLRGEVPPAGFSILEHGYRFQVNLAEGQKTGYYLDQRENRIAASRYAEGRTVLDAFCYSGGFGIHAAQAGATSVQGVDASETALELGRANAEANGLNNVTFLKDDVFGNLVERVKRNERFGMIVLDPPKFARNRAAIPKAMTGYRKLHLNALKLLEADGILVSCCCTGLISMEMFEDMIAQAAMESRRTIQILERRGASADHPVNVACRESAYLKCIIAKVVPEAESNPISIEGNEAT